MMGSTVILREGDLIEMDYGRGYPDIPEDLRVRAVVISFCICETEFGEIRTDILLRIGRREMEPIGAAEVSNKDMSIKVGELEPQKNDIKPCLMSLSFEGLKERNYEIVRRANSPNDLWNYDLDKNPNSW